MKLHAIYRVLFSFLIFNNAVSCELPEDLYPMLITYALNGNIKFVPVLKLVSKKFYAIINSPHLMKTIGAQNIGRGFCSDYCTEIINTPGSKKYKEVNRVLMDTWDADAYLEILKNEPYADINCQLLYCRRYTSKLDDICFYKDIKQKEKAKWIVALLDHGANPHNATIETFKRLNEMSLYSSSTDEYDKNRRREILEIFLKHNDAREAGKKYIEAKHFSIGIALEQIRGDNYKDRRPFMTWCVDYLTLIAKYGFDIKTVQPHPLHYHLHKNSSIAPVMVKYLVQELGCDPYEIVDVGDGSEPESPYMIVNKLSDEPMKQELLAIFQAVEKQI